MPYGSDQTSRDFSGHLVVRTLPFNARTWDLVLAFELKSHMPCDQKTIT